MKRQHGIAVAGAGIVALAAIALGEDVLVFIAGEDWSRSHPKRPPPDPWRP